MLRRVADHNLRLECQNMYILYFLNFIHLNVNGTCRLQCNMSKTMIALGEPF